MACSITNLKVTAVGPPGGTATSITISGHAEECKKVHVELVCSVAPFIADVEVDSVTGEWSVTTRNLPCSCDKEFKLVVNCLDDPTCQANLTGVIECKPQEGECPVVTDVSISTASDCNPDGTRDVTINATITNGTGGVAVAQWEFEPGAFGPVIVVAQGATLPVSQTHSYAAPGSYTAVLSFSLPTSCPPFSVAVKVNACPPLCLEDEDLTISVSPNCNADGTRTVTFTFPVVISGQLLFGDGEDIFFTGSSISHEYMSPGPYMATLIVEGCNRVVKTVGPLEPCPVICPQPGSIGVTVGNCNPDGTRNVTFTMPFMLTAHIDFGDGEDVSFTGSNVTHGYLPPGPFTATVTVEGCPPIFVSVGPLDECDGVPRGACCLPNGSCVETTADECRRQGGAYQGDGTLCANVNCGGDDDGGGGGGCGAFGPLIAILMAVALGLTLLLITLQSCLSVPVPGWLWGVIIGIWVAVAIAIAAWYFLCKIIPICPCPDGCDWLSFLWPALLAGAIVASYLSGCCGGFMLAIAIGLFVLASGLFALWHNKCDPSRCETLDLLALAVVTGAGTALSYLALVPAISACGLGWVAAVASTLGALLVAAAIACHNAES
jgi:hypothetical protein